MRRSSTPQEQETIDEKRGALVAMFAQLKDLQMAAGIVENRAKETPIGDNETEYDEYEDSTIPTSSSLSPIERKVLVIPSNGNLETNVSHLEIKFRTRQAQTELNYIRDLIADISFQFSHVIRSQHRKNVRTRSQKRIKSIHNQLTLHARIYSRCRNHLVALKCGQTILRQYRVLTKEDLKSSTAILDPNQPGSTSLRLSWIWHGSKWLLMKDNSFTGSNVNVGMGPIDPEIDSDPVPMSGPEPAAAAGPAPTSEAFTLHECMCIVFSMQFHTY